MFFVFAFLEITEESLIAMAGWYLVFIISITLHEAGHAFAAWKLGDPTAFYGGQVTINPIPHIERSPVGTILVPLASFFFFNGNWMMGWASAPYDIHWAIRYPNRAIIMALAGPAANLLLCVVAGVIIRIGLATNFYSEPNPADFGTMSIVVAKNGGMAIGAAKLVSILFSLNLILLVFNLIPVPPLDGGNVLLRLLNQETGLKIQHYMSQPMFALLGLMVAIRLFRIVFWDIFFKAISFLY